MNKSKYRMAADLVFVIHCILVFIVLFGWYYPTIKYLYFAALVTTLVSELTLGYCILTKWEFDLRKKTQPNLNYNYQFVAYYAYKYFGINPPAKLIKYFSLVFLAGSLVVFYARA